MPPTVALFKPDFVARGAPNVKRALDLLKDKGFVIIREQHNVQWNKDQAAAFYALHAGKWYLGRLVSNMSAGPFHAFLLDREDNQDPITAWRSLLSTELRPRYGISDTRNSFHGSSDPDEAEREATAFWTL